MGNVLAEKTDVIAAGYAVYFDIATAEMAEKTDGKLSACQIWCGYRLSTEDRQNFSAIYHNRGVWPGWEAALMEAAMVGGNHELAGEIMKSIMYGAARNLSNEEVINYETGAGRCAPPAVVGSRSVGRLLPSIIWYDV